MEVSCDLRQFEECHLAEHIVPTNDDMKAVNTEADPNHVTPTHSDATKLGEWKNAHRSWKTQLECDPSYKNNGTV